MNFSYFALLKKEARHLSTSLLLLFRNGPDSGNGGVDLLLRIVKGKTETHGSLLRGAQSLVHPWSAVRAGARGDAVGNGEFIGHGRGIIIPDVQSHDGATLRHGKISVNGDAGDVPDALIKPLHKGVFCALNILHAPL